MTGLARDDDVRVLIADDHGIVRSGLRMLLEQQDDIEVIADAPDGATARDVAIRERRFRIVVDYGYSAASFVLPLVVGTTLVGGWLLAPRFAGTIAERLHMRLAMGREVEELDGRDEVALV